MPLTVRTSSHAGRARRLVALAALGFSTLVAWRAPVRATHAAGAVNVLVVGTVQDAKTGRRLENVDIRVTTDEGAAAGAVSDATGEFRIVLPFARRGITLWVTARRLGYAPTVSKLVASTDTMRLHLALQARLAQLQETTVTASRISAEKLQNAPAQFSGAGSARIASLGDARSRPRYPESRTGFGRADSLSRPDWNREQYDRIHDNPFLAVRGNPRSTFSVDVDRASYGNVRRFLSQGQLPPADAVRIEELVNYFPYRLAEPKGDAPVAITTEAMPAPWQPRHHLVRVALQARRIDTQKLPPGNLVFLIDVSGSMMSPDKLPLVKASLRLLVDQLRPQDRVALVVYAGAAGVVLPSTSGAEKARIMQAIDRLEAGGSTAGGAGLELAYRTAREYSERGGNNRVILATDGDFNVGASSDAAMERLIESKRAEGTYLTVLGFGTGNLQDAKMQKIAKVGNGNYAYVDDLAEARKVLVREMGATLVTVANDVKLQVEFNPARVAAYRLIGYEDRLLRDEDFTDDRKDAGDMGAGHSVTALYEVVPVGVTGTVEIRTSDPLRYATDAAPARGRDAGADELLHVSLRYKRPGESASRQIAATLGARSVRERPSDDLRFASAVAGFGMLLRQSEYKGSATGADVIRLARGSADDDEEGYRGEFIKLVEQWQEVSRGIAARPTRRDW